MEGEGRGATREVSPAKTIHVCLGKPVDEGEGRGATREVSPAKIIHVCLGKPVDGGGGEQPGRFLSQNNTCSKELISHMRPS